MKRIIAAVIFLSLPALSFSLEISDRKKALIDQLLEQTGQSTKDTAVLMANSLTNQMIHTLKATQPDLEPRAYGFIADEIKLVITEYMLNDSTMTELMYKVYGPRFTEDELKSIVDFYNTDTGRKLIKELPAITKQSMLAGQDIARSFLPILDERIKARLQLEGINISPEQY